MNDIICDQIMQVWERHPLESDGGIWVDETTASEWLKRAAEWMKEYREGLYATSSFAADIRTYADANTRAFTYTTMPPTVYVTPRPFDTKFTFKDPKWNIGGFTVNNSIRDSIIKWR